MKKLLAILTVFLMSAAILLSYSKTVKTALSIDKQSKLTYATMVPIPPPRPKAPVGL